MKEKRGEHPLSDTGQLILLGMFLVVWIGDSFFLRQSTFLSRYLPLYIRLIMLGLALVSGMYLFRSGRVVVSHNKRPNSLVTNGSFRYVRHPLYLASLLTYFGLTISTASLFSFALSVGILVFYDYIAGYEEQLLEAKFEGEYWNYKKTTGKRIPRIRRN